MCGYFKVDIQVKDGGKRRVSQSLLSLLSPCVQIMKYKQETNPDALSHCWDNLSLGCPPGKTLPIRLQPLSLQPLAAKQTRIKRKNCMDIPCLLFRPFENSAVEGRSCPVVALWRVGISRKNPLWIRKNPLWALQLPPIDCSWVVQSQLGAVQDTGQTNAECE